MPVPQISLESARLAARHARSRLHFHRKLATGSPGAQLVELLGVRAIVVPVRPGLPIVNCVLAYDDADSLEVALPQLHEVYEQKAVHGWAAWIPDEDRAAAELLAGSGFAPRTSGHRMAGYILPQNVEPQLELDLVPAPTWRLLGECSDEAYGLPSQLGLADVFAGVSDEDSHVYAARAGDRVAAALVAREQAGDCYLAFVATVPDARGEGIGGELVRHALRLAYARGCTTASGESTPGALSLYRRVGARDLGGDTLWVRRA